MTIDLEKMERYLLKEYPNKKDDILNGIKVLKFEYDKEECDYVGKERTSDEILDFVQKLDDAIEHDFWADINEVPGYDEAFEDAAFELYSEENSDEEEDIENSPAFERFKVEHCEEIQTLAYERLDDNETDEWRRVTTEAVADGNNLPVVLLSYLCENALPNENIGAAGSIYTDNDEKSDGDDDSNQ